MIAILKIDGVSLDRLEDLSPSDQDYIFRLESQKVSFETALDHVILYAKYRHEAALRREASWLRMRLEGIFGKNSVSVEFAELECNE